MKIIDLLNKIANGEKVPKKFIIKGSCFKDLYFEYNKKYNCYDLIGEKFKSGCYVFGYSELNDEVEILEEEPYVEVCGNWFTKSEYDKLFLKEEKEIPEKIDHLIGYDIQQFDDLKEYVEITTNDLFGKINKVIDTLNQVIDYFKSKGE